MRFVCSSQDVPTEPNVLPSSRAAAAAAWAALVSIALSSLIVAGVSTARPHSERLAVVFPPWWSAERSLAAAAEIAPVAGVGSMPFIVAVHADNSEVYRRLVDAGAWAVLDGTQFAFCMSK